jgi:hypothetical protein
MKRTPVLALLLVLLSGCGLDSESSLRKRFAAYQTAVTELLQMQREDAKVIRIAPTFTRLENDWSWPRADLGFSRERWDRYKALFEEAGVSDGIQKDGEYTWYFVSSVGLAVSGASRGFVYTEAEPSPVVESLGHCPPRAEVCFVKLKEHWYLFHWAS